MRTNMLNLWIDEKFKHINTAFKDQIFIQNIEKLSINYSNSYSDSNLDKSIIDNLDKYFNVDNIVTSYIISTDFQNVITSQKNHKNRNTIVSELIKQVNLLDEQKSYFILPKKRYEYIQDKLLFVKSIYKKNLCIS